MIKIPKCPECGSDTAPDLIEINILEEDEYATYEELYECKCGCRYVALTPRYVHEKTLTHRVEHEEKKFCLSTQY